MPGAGVSTEREENRSAVGHGRVEIGLRIFDQDSVADIANARGTIVWARVDMFVSTIFTENFTWKKKEMTNGYAMQSSTYHNDLEERERERSWVSVARESDDSYDSDASAR